MNAPKIPTNDREALTLALYLCLTAPADAEFDQCLGIAKGLARHMDPEEVQIAKYDADRRWRAEGAA